MAVVAARPSISLRNASCVSAGEAADHLAGLDADREQDLDERPVGDVLAVVEAAAAEDVGALAGAPRNSSVSRDLPTPAGPSSVNM